METGATVLPHFFKDTTDRNRTSPFAFTGNKFEFRSLGSSFSVSGPNVVLNTAVAEALSQFADQLEGVPAEELTTKVHELLKKAIVDHKRVIFNGNGYTDEWVQEAERRGLYNLRSTPDALPVFIADKNVKLFTKHHIFTESEINSRYEILLENYTKTIHIEAKTLEDMLKSQFLPALATTIEKTVALAAKKQKVSQELPVTSEIKLAKKLSGFYDTIYDAEEKLEADTEKAEGITDELEQAKFYQSVILDDMAQIRTVADEAETLIPKDILPYPTYADMLFYV